MIHVISHNLAISPEDLWAQIVKWVPWNLEWIKSISVQFLARKKTDDVIFEESDSQKSQSG